MKNLKLPAVGPLLVAVLLLCMAGPSSAATSSAPASPVVVFDSIGSGSFLNVAWGITGASTSYGYRGQAEWFVPGISGNLSSFTLGTHRFSGSGRSNFFIAADNGYGPGAILESYPNVLNNANGLLTLASTSNPFLEGGTKYWICDEPSDNTTVNGWFENGINYFPGFAYERAQWSWNAFTDTAHSPPSGAFRVSVTPIPEPDLAALAFLAALLAALRQTKALNRNPVPSAF